MGCSWWVRVQRGQGEAHARQRLTGGSKFVGERREKPTRVEVHLIKVGFCFTSQAS